MLPLVQVTADPVVAARHGSDLDRVLVCERDIAGIVDELAAPRRRRGVVSLSADALVPAESPSSSSPVADWVSPCSIRAFPIFLHQDRAIDGRDATAACVPAAWRKR